MQMLIIFILIMWFIRLTINHGKDMLNGEQKSIAVGIVLILCDALVLAILIYEISARLMPVSTVL